MPQTVSLSTLQQPKSTNNTEQQRTVQLKSSYIELTSTIHSRRSQQTVTADGHSRRSPLLTHAELFIRMKETLVEKKKVLRRQKPCKEVYRTGHTEMSKTRKKESWHDKLATSIRKISKEQTATVLPRKLLWLLETQGEVKDPVIEKLLETVNNENDQELEHVLKVENNQLERIKQTDIRGASLLHYACSRNSVAVADVLIRHGFEVNRKTSKDMDLYVETFDYVSRFRAGSTPIYIATVSGLTGIVNLLAKNGADPNIPDCEGYTPLHNAAWHNKTELIRQLLSNDAKVNVQDYTGSTPLRKAAYRGNLDSVRQLLNCGADPNIKTKKGRAAIHCAALYGHTDILSLLLHHGATVNIQDNDDITPLHAAVYNGKRLAVRVLLKSDADVHLQTKFGNTPLHLACMEKWFVLVGLLAQAGASFDIENRFGETPAIIINTGNAGKRICSFNKQLIPSIAELENMEAEYRGKNHTRQTSVNQAGLNGQTTHLSSVHELNPTQPAAEHREKKKK